MQTLEEIRRMGVTHVWYTGTFEHASTTAYPEAGIQGDPPEVVKGIAGSPYAVRDYYDVNPDLAEDVHHRMEEFEALIDRTHKAGLKVIIDFIPNHVARNYHSDIKPETDFGPENYFILADGSRLYGSPDWYDTVKLNYTDDTRCKMLDILLFWANKGVDGFRCDMAEMVPLDFWAWVIPKVKEQSDVLFIAEVYQPHLYRPYLYEGQFDYLYDKVGLYDTLRAVIRGEIPAARISYCLEELSDIRPRMLHFLENHDEQRIASSFFAGDALRAFPAMILIATVSTSPFMIYFGQEVGEPGNDAEGFSGLDGRTSIFDYWSLCVDPLNDYQAQIRNFYAKLCHIALTERAITEGLYYNLTSFINPAGYAYFRYLGEELILVVLNFSDTAAKFVINIPQHAFEFCGIPDNKAMEAIDLFTGERRLAALTQIYPYSVAVQGYGGKVIKFKLLAHNKPI
jgi:glycosidase